jgi:effector-binding domain-containing protein
MSTTMTAPPTPRQSPDYPVHVKADAHPHASRWLWLVKWLLLIPHAVVLAVLWIAFVVLSLAAFVAILVTGRYPRAMFDFNLGVMRWSWRVSYYGYSALATDQYPPFTLSDVPDYPAHLEVDYPEHLSRGLVLVKWWLLALPHYLVVGILVGGGTWWVADDDSPARFAWGGGLVGVLVLVGAVVLALTGRYPRSLYDLVMGLNRWVLRVCAYAALMTDDYPPFRLDMGPDEPGGTVSPGDAERGPAAPAMATAPATRVPQAQRPEAGTGWTAGRIIGVVVGSLLAMTSLAVLTGGTALLVADNAMRDDAGYVTWADREVSSSGYAVTIPSFRLDTGPGATTLPRRMLGDVRLRATAPGGDSVFVGIASSSEVERYLGDVARAVPDAGWADGREIAGGAPTTPPTELAIWDASVVGTGTNELNWTPRSGDWALVLMNADASADVSADVSVGAQLPWLGRAGVAVLIGGLILLVGGVSLVATAVRRASRQLSGTDGSRMTSATKPFEYQIESVTLPEQPTLVVRGTIGQGQFGSFLGAAFARVSEVAQADGMYVSGPPFARLHPEPDGTFTVEAGFPVSGMLLGQGDVKAAHLPGGSALRTTHRGGYAETRNAHEALHAYASGHGMSPAGDAWEVYLDGPDVAEPRTLVVLPIRPSSEAPATAAG